MIIASILRCLGFFLLTLWMNCFPPTCPPPPSRPPPLVSPPTRVPPLRTILIPPNWTMGCLPFSPFIIRHCFTFIRPPSDAPTPPPPRRTAATGSAAWEVLVDGEGLDLARAVIGAEHGPLLRPLPATCG